jgi:hypothetical protein
LKAAGITKIVQASATGSGSEIEVAMQIRKKRLVMLLGYTPGSIMTRIFAPPDFALVPIAESSWEAGELALAWLRGPGVRRAELDAVVDRLVEVFAADRPPSSTVVRPGRGSAGYGAGSAP